jgi:hypothetical protein
MFISSVIISYFMHVIAAIIPHWHIATGRVGAVAVNFPSTVRHPAAAPPPVLCTAPLLM